MELTNANAVVTGGAGGIGRAIGAALKDRGANVLLADLSPAVVDTAAELGVTAWQGDVSSVSGIRSLLAKARQSQGEIDIYFANAGIVGPPELGEDEAEWDRVIDVNVRAHIRAAKELIPEWTQRGRGYFVTTASAAGLLTQIGQAGYSVTKHAAVGFAEWLSITYGDQGVGVTCLCPMGVKTAMLEPAAAKGATDRQAAAAVTSAGEVKEPAEVAEVVLGAVEDEIFLALPHPEVLDMYRMKGSDYDRWLRGMRRYQATLRAAG